MAYIEQDKMSESANKGPVINRRDLFKLGAAAFGAGSLSMLPDTARALARGAEQGVLIEEHLVIISRELPGVKTRAILLDMASGTGIHQIMEEEAEDGRVNYANGQVGRAVGVIPGVGRQTVAIEFLTAKTKDGDRLEVGMRLPENKGNDRYPAAVAAQFVDGLDRKVDSALGFDFPIEKFAVALRAPKGTPVVYLGDHSLQRLEPEVDPSLVLKPIDLVAIIQRSSTGAAYILKVGNNEVRVENALVIRDELLVSAGALSGVVITENMLPTPTPIEQPKPKETGYQLRAGGRLSLRADKLAVKNTAFEYSPSLDPAEADRRLENLTVRAFANAMGLDTEADPNVLTPLIEKGKLQLNVARTDANGKIILRVPEGGFPVVDVKPGRMTMDVRTVKTSETDAFPLHYRYKEQNVMEGSMGVALAADKNGELVCEIAMDQGMTDWGETEALNLAVETALYSVAANFTWLAQPTKHKEQLINVDDYLVFQNDVFKSKSKDRLLKEPFA